MGALRPRAVQRATGVGSKQVRCAVYGPAPDGRDASNIRNTWWKPNAVSVTAEEAEGKRSQRVTWTMSSAGGKPISTTPHRARPGLQRRRTHSPRVPAARGARRHRPIAREASMSWQHTSTNYEEP